MWPTWSQAAVAAMIAGLVALALRRSRPTRLGDIVGSAALEFAFVASLYSIWRMAKNLPLTRTDGATERACDIVAVQEFFGLPSELALQQFALAAVPGNARPLDEALAEPVEGLWPALAEGEAT